jgi:hypothetical protein
MKDSKKLKVIYAEVKPDTYKALEDLCKKLDLPKTKVLTKAIQELSEKTKLK